MNASIASPSLLTLRSAAHNPRKHDTIAAGTSTSAEKNIDTISAKFGIMFAFMATKKGGGRRRPPVVCGFYFLRRYTAKPNANTPKIAAYVAGSGIAEPIS